MRKLCQILVFLILSTVILHGSELEKADRLYFKGFQAKTQAEKEVSINASLAIYLKQKNDNLKTFERIANCYFELEQYPWAVLYYSKALSMIPNEERVWNQLHQTQKILGVPLTEKKMVFSFHSLIGLFNLFYFFFFLSLSLYLWFPGKVYRYSLFTSSTISLILLFSLLFRWYFSPIEAITIKPSSLYLDSNEASGIIPDLLIYPGSTIEVLEAGNQGLWLKIKTEKGALGYVPYENVRLI